MLEGQTAYVTGASQGIGREIAIKLAEEGANVTLAARNEENLEETADLIDDRDGTLVAPTDITDEDAVEASIEATIDAFGGLDTLVNNAGIAGPTAPVEEVTVEDWRTTLDINLMGMFLTVKHASPHLRQSSRGSIVNISSISGKRPLPSRTPYVASKMGVMGLTRTLAFEFGDDDVTVNTICPGAVEGDRIIDVIEKQADQMGVSFEEAKASLTDDQALSGLVKPRGVPKAVAFLASEAGRHITAQDINVDRGATWY